MKFTVTVVTLVAIAVLVNAEDHEDTNRTPFVQSWMNLYRGPPEFKANISSAAVQTKWMTQKLDHFNEQNENTWKMRYLVNDEHFEDGGAIFIFLGGQWTISAGTIKSGLFYDLVKEHKGILFYTEHRYYGKSRPTSDLSPENLQYLHVKQALADLAHFIRTQRETDPRLAKSKVIISGCAYSATMTAWFSNLYPELVNGGWASSAPILAKVDFKEYKRLAGNVLQKLGSRACYNRVRNGIAELETMFSGTRSAEAKTMLQLCNSFNHDNDLDLWSLFSTISNIYSDLVQSQSGNDIAKHCEYLLDFDDDVTAISKFFLKHFSRGKSCIDISYNSTLSDFSYLNYKNPNERSWYYQTCNEYGWYQTSASLTQPFGTNFPLALYTTLCYDIYGAQYTNERIGKLVDATNAYFRGHNLKVENVHMTHGNLDPWREIGLNKDEGASIIPQASHCADMNSIQVNDSPEMRASKERLVELVRQWLA